MVKKLKALQCTAVNGTPSHSYRVSLASCTWDHTVLPATRHKWTHPALTPARQAGTRSTYPGGMEDWVTSVRLHHGPIVYGQELNATCWSRVRRPNFATTLDLAKFVCPASTRTTRSKSPTITITKIRLCVHRCVVKPTWRWGHQYR